MVRNKISNQSNNKYFALLLLLFFYESIIAFMRLNILIIPIGIILYMFITPNKNTITLDIIKKIILFSIILLGLFRLVLYLESGYIDKTTSTDSRILEGIYVYENHIADNLIFGEGLGKTYIHPKTGEPQSEVHFGFFTILLKFGLVGLISITLLILLPGVQYFIFSNTTKVFNTKKIVLLVPSLFIWFFSLAVVKGTAPEHMFGLGLAIGSYFQFSKAQYKLNFNPTDRIIIH